MNPSLKRREPRPGGGGSQRESANAACVDSIAEAPEHRNDRRRFLIWALMIGAVPPQRVTERIVSELEDGVE